MLVGALRVVCVNVLRSGRASHTCVLWLMSGALHSLGKGWPAVNTRRQTVECLGNVKLSTAVFMRQEIVDFSVWFKDASQQLSIYLFFSLSLSVCLSLTHTQTHTKKPSHPQFGEPLSVSFLFLSFIQKNILFSLQLHSYSLGTSSTLPFHYCHTMSGRIYIFKAEKGRLQHCWMWNLIAERVACCVHIKLAMPDDDKKLWRKAKRPTHKHE